MARARPLPWVPAPFCCSARVLRRPTRVRRWSLASFRRPSCALPRPAAHDLPRRPAPDLRPSSGRSRPSGGRPAAGARRQGNVRVAASPRPAVFARRPARARSAVACALSAAGLRLIHVRPAVARGLATTVLRPPGDLPRPPASGRASLAGACAGLAGGSPRPSGSGRPDFAAAGVPPGGGCAGLSRRSVLGPQFRRTLPWRQPPPHPGRQDRPLALLAPRQPRPAGEVARGTCGGQTASPGSGRTGLVVAGCSARRLVCGPRGRSGHVRPASCTWACGWRAASARDRSAVLAADEPGPPSSGRAGFAAACLCGACCGTGLRPGGGWRGGLVVGEAAPPGGWCVGLAGAGLRPVGGVGAGFALGGVRWVGGGGVRGRGVGSAAFWGVGSEKVGG